MTPVFFYGFAVGAFTALFISTIFFSVKYHELYEENQQITVSLWNLTQRAEHLEQEANPLLWVDSSDVKVVKKAQQRLYDKHEALIKPGTEVIRIAEDDVPNA